MIQRLLTSVGLLVFTCSIPALSTADMMDGPESRWAGPYASGKPLNGLDSVTGWSASSLVDFHREGLGAAPLSMKDRDSSLGAMIFPTDQTTLIGHLTREEFASLAEIARVIEMYIVEDGLLVRFAGGAWPGSLFSVFETLFRL
jgi:hypothetical protein